MSTTLGVNSENCEHFSTMTSRPISAAAAAAYPALILSLGNDKEPGKVHKCVIETNGFGPLTISSRSTPTTAAAAAAAAANLARPDVATLSILHLGGLLEGGEVEEEIPLFASVTSGSSNNYGKNNIDEKSQALLELLPSLQGIQERLSDAATSNPQQEGVSVVGHLELFLLRSEAVVAELLSAVEQQRQREARAAAAAGGGRKRKRSAAMSTSIAANSNATACCSSSGVSVSYYASLLNQLSILENQPDIVTVDLSDDLFKVMITSTDESKRQHELTAELPPTFPTSGGRPIFYCDLPLGFDPKWKSSPKKEIWIDDGYAVIGNSGREAARPSGSSSSSTNGSSNNGTSYGLVHVYHQFHAALSSYQTLWNDLDELDSSAWILEPSLPATRAAVERRIALKPGLSLALTLDPERPRAPPLSARLVGSSVDAAGLGERVGAYVDGDHNSSGGDDSWDETMSIKANIEKCICFDLPSPTTTEKADYVAECGICYAHRLPPADAGEGVDGGGGTEGEGSIPDAICANPSCARSYHESCLFEWLHSLPGARVSFDRVFGTCPYCSEALSVRVLSRATATN